MIRQAHRSFHKQEIATRRSFKWQAGGLKFRMPLANLQEARPMLHPCVRPANCPLHEGAIYAWVVQGWNKLKAGKPLRRKIVLGILAAALLVCEVYGGMRGYAYYREAQRRQEIEMAQRRELLILEQLKGIEAKLNSALYGTGGKPNGGEGVEEEPDRIEGINARIELIDAKVGQNAGLLEMIRKTEMRQRRNNHILIMNLRQAQEHMIEEGYALDGGLIEEVWIRSCPNGGECR